jgi:NAD(P)-dependent dehydrogenase (short-subunit alcohol dehydrogenase family)
VAIVTGGAQGIGEAIVRMFVKHGALAVVITDIADAAGGRAGNGMQLRALRRVRGGRRGARRAARDVFCNNAGASTNCYIENQTLITTLLFMNLNSSHQCRIIR